jgi:HD superfamily phosphodiesterase
MADKRIEREAKEVLINYLKDNMKENSGGLKFIAGHSMRVEAYCMEIANSYKYLSEIDIWTLKTAAIFHDIGYTVQSEKHGIIGGEIVNSLFDKTECISKCGVKKECLVDIISRHSDKDDPNDNDILSIILKDADILDQIGAMSILMHSSKYDYNSLDFYQNILNDINGKEFKFIEGQRKFLRTDAARRILDRKAQFVREFSNELEYELKGDLEMNCL